MSVWSPTLNLFDNATKRSLKKMLVLASDHLSKLKAEEADATINGLYLRTKPVHDQFMARYNDRKSAKAQYKGRTLQMKLLLKELRQTKAKEWDVQIQNHYLQGKPEYTTLMPKRKRPFQSGGTDARITNIKALSRSLEAYPALAAIKTDVDDFHAVILQARKTQQETEEVVAKSISELKLARLDMATMMYRNLGVLMDKFAHTPAKIDNFWQLDVLQQ